MGGPRKATVVEAVAGFEGEAAEGVPGEADAGSEIIAVLREKAGGDLREKAVEDWVGILGGGKAVFVVADSEVKSEGRKKAEVILDVGGEFPGFKDDLLLAEALGVGAEAEDVDGGVDGGATAIGVGVDVEGVIGDPVDETTGAAFRGSTVVLKGAFLVVEGGDGGVLTVA